MTLVIGISFRPLILGVDLRPIDLFDPRAGEEVFLGEPFSEIFTEGLCVCGVNLGENCQPCIPQIQL